jgi:hypothetical protein
VKLGDHELDLLTRPEAREMFAAQRPPTELVRAEESGITDANGNLVLPIYVVPAAMEFRVHVVNVEADGFSPAVMFNGAGGFWQLRVAGRVIDERSLVAAAPSDLASQLPFTRTYGFMQGAVAVNNEPFELLLNAGPVNTVVRALAQGTLVARPGTPPEQ